MSGALVRPRALRPGDTVMVVSASWGGPAVFPGPYDAGLRVLRDVFELEVIEAPTARMPPDRLARDPRARADALNQAFADDSVRAIISTIGGSG